MSSLLKKLVQRNQQQVDNSSSLVSVSEQHRAWQLRHKKLQENFINMIIILLSSEQELYRLTSPKLQKYRQQVIQRQARKLLTNDQTLQQTIGIFVKNIFQSDVALATIKQELALFYEEDELDEPSSLCENQEEGQGLEYLQSIIRQLSKDESNSRFDAARTDPNNSLSSAWTTSIKQQVNQSHNPNQSSNWLPKDSTFSQSKDPHQNQVIDYLCLLAAPQAELNYLKDHMQWKLKYQERQIEDQFQVKAIVDFKFNHIEKIMQDQHMAKSKKLGRKCAAAKLLRKIYLGFPEIWMRYSQIRNQRSLHVDINPYGSSQLSVILSQEQSVQVQQPLKNNQNHQTQVNIYLSKVKNFKTELSYLIQQTKGKVASPPMSKMEDKGQWKVKGEINVQEWHFKDIVANKNSKQAEKIVAENLVRQVYLEFINIFKIMQQFKNKMGEVA